MKLFLIKRKDDTFYNECDAKVIRATGESPARRIASQNPGDEGPDVWLDPEYSDCEEINPKGKQGEILSKLTLGSFRD